MSERAPNLVPGWTRDELYRRIVETTPYAVWVVDASNRTVLVSQHMARLLGREPAELRGTPMLDHVDGSSRDVAATSLREPLGSIGPAREIVFRRANGVPLPARLWTTPLHDPSVHRAGVLAIVSDLSEYTRLHEALRNMLQGRVESDQFFQHLVRSLAELLHVDTVLVARFDATPPENAHIVAAWSSGRSVESFGYRLAGTPCADVLARGTVFRPRGVRSAFSSCGWREQLGSDVEAYLGTLLFASDGRPIGLLAALHGEPIDEEPTSTLLQAFAGRAAGELERLQTVQALRSSEAKLKSILHAVPDLVMVFDRECRYREVFTGDESLVVAPAARLIGRRFRDFVPAALGARCEAIVAEVIRTGERQTVEYELSTGGQDRTWSANIVPLHAGGSDTQVLWLTRDITAQRKAERELQRASRLDSIGQLAAGVAHDFNNILQVMMGCAEMVASAVEAGSAAAAALDDLVAAGRRAADLTRQLLMVGRRQMIEPRAIDLHALVAQTVQMLRRVIPSHIRIAWHPASMRAVVMADPGQLENVLINLCVNARDAMQDGGELTIATAPVRGESGAPERVRLTVTDTGSGMTPEVLERAFEPFFTTKGASSNGGMGLAIAHGIVHQHNGTLRADSAPGRGTTIEIVLPICAAEPDDESREEDTPAVLRSGTILVVEDEEPVRRLLCRVLRDAGFATLEAGDGEEAVERFREQNGAVDLVLLDMVMPKASGREAAARIRELAPAVPILFSSGYDPRALPHALERAEVLAKPYRIATLLAAVDRLLGDERSGR